MKLLLDTHAFLWFSEDSARLSSKARQLIENPENSCFVSMASIWEMAIKISLKKLEIKVDFSGLLSEVERRQFDVLPIEFSHIQVLISMDFHHRDPFDRLLIAQSKAEEMCLVSAEEMFDRYMESRIW